MARKIDSRLPTLKEISKAPFHFSGFIQGLPVENFIHVFQDWADEKYHFQTVPWSESAKAPPGYRLDKRPADEKAKIYANLYQTLLVEIDKLLDQGVETEDAFWQVADRFDTGEFDKLWIEKDGSPKHAKLRSYRGEKTED